MKQDLLYSSICVPYFTINVEEGGGGVPGPGGEQGGRKSKQISTVNKNIIGAPKYEISIVLPNFFFFQNCNSNIGLFSIAYCKVIAMNLLCLIFGIITLLHFSFYI